MFRVAYRVMKSHQSLINLLYENRVHGTVLFCRMADGACRRRRRVGLGVVSRPVTPLSLLFSPHACTLSSTSHPHAYLRWLRSEVQVSTFYSSTRVSQRPPVAVHVHVIAELLARACHVTCARTPRFRPPRPADRVFRTFRDSAASGSVPPSRPRKLAPLLVIRAHLSEQ